MPTTGFKRKCQWRVMHRARTRAAQGARPAAAKRGAGVNEQRTRSRLQREAASEMCRTRSAAAENGITDLLNTLILSFFTNGRHLSTEVCVRLSEQEPQRQGYCLRVHRI
jgi:hypothetical protein